MNLQLKFASWSITYSCVGGSLFEDDFVETLKVFDLRVLEASLLALSSVLVLVDHCKSKQSKYIEVDQNTMEVSESQ